MPNQNILQKDLFTQADKEFFQNKNSVNTQNPRIQDSPQVSNRQNDRETIGLNGKREIGEPSPAFFYWQSSETTAETTSESTSETTESKKTDTADTSAGVKEKDSKENRPNSKDEKELSTKEQQKLEYLKKRDAEVKAHEQAHMAAGGQYITSPAQYQYERGPDGSNYAVGGEVGIDTSAVPNDPQATIIKMEVVQRAALAPMEPSSQDRMVASRAAQLEVAAQMESGQKKETQASKDTQSAKDTSEKNSPNSVTGTGRLSADTEESEAELQSSSNIIKPYFQINPYQSPKSMAASPKGHAIDIAA
ncbi:MAG: hypothetical protein HQK77_06400 [Desulfobacterales bacterium]|nr:hypothetical protein [Desulfobacterales bacterium]